jgi:hypothetical protein
MNLSPNAPREANHPSRHGRNISNEVEKTNLKNTMHTPAITPKQFLLEAL